MQVITSFFAFLVSSNVMLKHLPVHYSTPKVYLNLQIYLIFFKAHWLRNGMVVSDLIYEANYIFPVDLCRNVVTL